MRHLTKHLRTYIDYCSKCELNQIKRHKPYESMISIDRSEIPFHIIIMNFIVALSVIANGCDCLLIVIDKFFKRVLMMSGKTIYIVAKWVDLLLVSLSQSN